MTRVNLNDIIFRLDVTALQIENAIYSGALPQPLRDEHNLIYWEPEHIEFYLQNWQARLERRRPKADNKHITTGCLTIPRHQR